MIQTLQTGVLGVNTYIVYTSENKCFVVDPASCKLSGDETKILDFLSENHLECEGIVITHSHFDHVTGILPLQKKFPNVKIAIHKAESQDLQNNCGDANSSMLSSFGMHSYIDEVAKQPSANVLLQEGDDWFGWKVLHTPGHSPGSICLYNKEENALITGDTMFANGGYGRTDFVGGDSLLLIQSLGRLQDEIPAGTLVYPGHDEFGFKI